MEEIEVIRTVDGRYKWDEEECAVHFYPRGEKVATKTIPLHSDSNNYNGAVRVAARDLLRTHPAGAVG